MIDYMQRQHATVLEAQLDREQYHDEDLLSLKVPLHLPYVTGSPDYERVRGSIEIEGITYEYVKRRVHRDTLELLCLPNRGKMHLQSAENEFFRLSLEGAPSQHEGQSTTIKIALPDYCQELPLFALAGLSPLFSKHFLYNTAFLGADYSLIGDHPPESMPHAI
jgi:hypothetical protein